jgi:hypothetical protein
MKASEIVSSIEGDKEMLLGDNTEMLKRQDKSLKLQKKQLDMKKTRERERKIAADISALSAKP